MSHSNGKADRKTLGQPWSTVLLAMIVAGPTGITAPRDIPRLELDTVKPDVMVRSMGERDIVNEEPADGSAPVGLESFGPSEESLPAGVEIEATGTPVEVDGIPQDPSAPRFLGVVNQDGEMKAIFLVPGQETPWLGKPGERIGNTRFRLESFQGVTTPLERTPDG